MRKVKYLGGNLCSSLKKCSGKLFISVIFEQRCRRKVFLLVLVPAVPYRVPTHPGKWEKPGNFIPLAPGQVMPLKIEKNNKNWEKPLIFSTGSYQITLNYFPLIIVLSSLYNFRPASLAAYHQFDSKLVPMTLGRVLKGAKQIINSVAYEHL